MEKITTKQGQKNILMTKRQFIVMVIVCVLLWVTTATMAVMTANTMNELKSVEQERNALGLKNSALDAENDELHKQIYYMEKEASD